MRQAILNAVALEIEPSVMLQAHGVLEPPTPACFQGQGLPLADMLSSRCERPTTLKPGSSNISEVFVLCPSCTLQVACRPPQSTISPQGYRDRGLKE
jgi:hypothetical protein